MEQNVELKSLTVKDYAYDAKIDAINVYTTIKVGEYLKIANSIKNNNDLQRRRVSNPSTVYALLKEDMLSGCLIPSIVLALDKEDKIEFDQAKIQAKEFGDIAAAVQAEATSLKILDGLQRTNILLDLENELSEKQGKDPIQIEEDIKKLSSLYAREIRVEIYVNITRFGILYRMLTLNTGQTPMSLRHQIEILYSDYYVSEKDGIILLRDAFDLNKPIKLGQYRFSDVVEGVTSFIEGSEFTLTRFDLLDYIKTLKKLSTESKKVDMFTSFIITYHTFLTEIIKKSDTWNFNFTTLSKENLDYFPVQKSDPETGREYRTSPFGNNAEDIFSKQQIYTAFGAAASFLKTKEVISQIDDLKQDFINIKFEISPKEDFDNLVVRLEQIRKESKKIGESQRTFFKHFFITLFNSKDSDSHLNFNKAVDSAYRKTI